MYKTLSRWPDIIRVAAFNGATTVQMTGWERRGAIPSTWQKLIIETSPHYGEAIGAADFLQADEQKEPA